MNCTQFVRICSIAMLGLFSCQATATLVTIEHQVTVTEVLDPFFEDRLDDGVKMNLTFDPSINFASGSGVSFTANRDGSSVGGDGPLDIQIFNDIVHPSFGLVDKVRMFASDGFDSSEIIQIGSTSILTDSSLPTVDQLLSFQFGTVDKVQGGELAWTGEFDPGEGSVVPASEPSTLGLLALGGAALGFWSRTRKSGTVTR